MFVLQEAAVIVLDVGPHMANYLPALRKSVFLLAESKVLFVHNRDRFAQRRN
jgi:hypothetical protein